MNTQTKDMVDISMNKRLQLAGIETDYLEHGNWDTYYLIYGDMCIPRPFDADQAPQVCLKHFGIVI